MSQLLIIMKGKGITIRKGTDIRIMIIKTQGEAVDVVRVIFILRLQPMVPYLRWNMKIEKNISFVMSSV